MNRRDARFKIQVGCPDLGTRHNLTEAQVTAILKANARRGNPCKVWQLREGARPIPAGGVACDKQGKWHWHLDIRLRKEPAPKPKDADENDLEELRFRRDLAVRDGDTKTLPPTTSTP